MEDYITDEGRLQESEKNTEVPVPMDNKSFGELINSVFKRMGTNKKLVNILRIILLIFGPLLTFFLAAAFALYFVYQYSFFTACSEIVFGNPHSS